MAYDVPTSRTRPTSAPAAASRRRCRRRRRSASVTIREMLTRSGTVVKARSSSAEWNDVSSISAAMTAPTARPSESTRAISSKRERFGAAVTAEGMAGSRIRNCSPFCRCSMLSASWASS